MEYDREQTAKLATGSYVAMLYLVFICVMFGGFAGYVSRVNLGKSLGPEVGTLDNLIFRGTRETSIRQRLEAARKQLSDAQENFRVVELKHAELKGQHHSLSARLIELFSAISTQISAKEDLLDPAFVKSFHEVYADTSLDESRKVERLRYILATVSFAEHTPPQERDAFIAQVTTALGKLDEKNSEIINLEVEMLKVAQQGDAFANTLNGFSRGISGLEGNLSTITGELKDQHRAIIASFKNTLWGVPYTLIQIPTIILTLFVTIAAGGLGSVVAFTRKFLRGHLGTTPGRLFVNVGEGVAAAVAIFFLAGAGMLMLTQGASGNEGRVELSPYMVAFIAFVSGFMAEDAFTRIQAAGKNLFQTDGDNANGFGPPPGVNTAPAPETADGTGSGGLPPPQPA